MYDGFLDVGDFVAESGLTSVETLDGSLDRTVQDVYLMEIGDKETGLRGGISRRIRVGRGNTNRRYKRLSLCGYADNGAHQSL